MKFWKVEWQEENSGSGIAREFFSNKRDAAKRAAALVRDGDNHPDFQLFGIEQVEIPTKRTKLLNWLNVNASAV